ncbi:MAG: GIY-YIG nuclease family protein [Succinimonas sp.]|nr:GIY-YIG nuclease family protein [Succinimonas sp.]
MKISDSENRLLKKPKTFEELLENDPFGLLDNVGEKRLSMSDYDKIDVFIQEAAEFVKEHKRLPDADSDVFEEQLLAEKLAPLIRDYPEKKAYLESFLPDRDKNVSEDTGLNTQITKDNQGDAKLRAKVAHLETQVFDSIDDVFSNDPLGLLNDVGDKPIEKEDWNKDRVKEQSSSVDGVVTRAIKCPDFYKYQRYFDEIDLLLKQGHLEAKDVVGDSAYIGLGNIFVIDGMMSLIAEAYEDAAQYDLSKSKLRYRVKQIFANGTESRPLSTSIKSSFYKSEPPCKRISSADHTGTKFLADMGDELSKAQSGSANAIMTGYVYILSSESNNPVIRDYTEHSNLVKIGYCTTDVKTRIANAANEPTYLCAPVKVLKTFKCYNFDPQNLEDILHTILGPHRLNVELRDGNGILFRPKEWFTVSVQTASEIVEHLFSGDLSHYYIDPIQGKLKRKQDPNKAKD